MKKCPKCGSKMENGKCLECIRRFNIRVIIFLILIIFFFFSYFIFFKEKPLPPEPIIINNQPVYIENQFTEDIYVNPDEYIGKWIDITGRIITNPVYENGVSKFAIFEDAINFKNITVIYEEGGVEYKAGDFVKLTGYVEGKQEFDYGNNKKTVPIIVSTECNLILTEEKNGEKNE